MKRQILLGLCLSAAMLISFAGPARADEIGLVNGTLWTKSTEDQKKAYLIGMVWASVYGLERSVGGMGLSHPVARNASVAR